MKRILITFLLLVNVAHALSEDQIQNLQVAYSMGKLVKAKDGVTFEKTMAAIMMVESSAGVNIIGDDRNKDGSKKPLIKSSLGPMQMKISTVRFISKITPSLQWVNTLNNKTITIQILNNPRLACLLAGYYIQMNYNNALTRKMSNPYFRTVSRYNGGWHNKTYYNKVIKAKIIIEDLIKQGKLR